MVKILLQQQQKLFRSVLHHENKVSFTRMSPVPSLPAHHLLSLSLSPPHCANCSPPPLYDLFSLSFFFFFFRGSTNVVFLSIKFPRVPLLLGYTKSPEATSEMKYTAALRHRTGKPYGQLKHCRQSSEIYTAVKGIEPERHKAS